MEKTKKHFSISINEKIAKKINDYRFENKINTKTEAIETLIKLGLDCAEKKKN